MTIQIRLDLTRHCVETAARIRVEQLIRAYFKSPDKESEDQIQALTLFLEQADFGTLRARISREGAPPNTEACLMFSTPCHPPCLFYNGRQLFP